MRSSVPRKVAALLLLAAIGVVALALALVLRSEAFAALGALTLAPALLALLVMVLFGQRPPADRHDHSFLAWLWRE
jgi:hypothetical protein